MTGPRVRLESVCKSLGTDGLEYELAFKSMGNVKGREKFWAHGESMTFLLEGVNPMAVETMEPGNEYDLVFSPVEPEK